MPVLLAVAGGLLFGLTPSGRADLIINAGFETPGVTSALLFHTLQPGSEPAGFGWHILSGNVDAVVQGPIYALTAYEGKQFLDLDGTKPGAIAQSFASTPGEKYVLSFAYANNPVFGATIPALGTVRVYDTTSGANLITPISLTHSNSTMRNPNWVWTGPIGFIPTGTQTTLSFTSNNPAGSLGGLFLDGVSVRGGRVQSVPEPASLSLALLGACAVVATRACRRPKLQSAE
jgi:hypothetical protein